MKYGLLLLATLAVACQPRQKPETGSSPPDSVVMTPTDTMITITDTAVVPALVESWKTFEQYNGKYASDVKLLQKQPLKERLKAILGAEEKDFTNRYGTTPPIEVDNGILFNEGCKPHNFLFAHLMKSVYSLLLVNNQSFVSSFLCRFLGFCIL